MGKWPVFSQKVDEISKSETPQTFINFSSLIHEYLGHLKDDYAQKDAMSIHVVQLFVSWLHSENSQIH